MKYIHDTFFGAALVLLTLAGDPATMTGTRPRKYDDSTIGGNGPNWIGVVRCPSTVGLQTTSGPKMTRGAQFIAAVVPGQMSSLQNMLSSQLGAPVNNKSSEQRDEGKDGSHRACHFVSARNLPSAPARLCAISLSGALAFVRFVCERLCVRVWDPFPTDLNRC